MKKEISQNKENPWNNIALSDYENHMQLNSVMQLQVLNQMMKGQLSRYEVSTAVILGIAGGNGLNHIASDKFKAVYGVDVNNLYLEECVRRYPDLNQIFIPIHCDIRMDYLHLPKAELLIANLIIEYVGYDSFMSAVKIIRPHYISCVIQKNEDGGFVSESPYLHAFDSLEDLHCRVEESSLGSCADKLGYCMVFRDEVQMPNGKKMICLDYQLNNMTE